MISTVLFYGLWTLVIGGVLGVVFLWAFHDRIPALVRADEEAKKRFAELEERKRREDG